MGPFEEEEEGPGPVVVKVEGSTPGCLRSVDTRKPRDRNNSPILGSGWTWPLENEINEMLGSKRADRFSDSFFRSDNNTSSFELIDFFKARRDMRKFPQECQQQKKRHC